MRCPAGHNVMQLRPFDTTSGPPALRRRGPDRLMSEMGQTRLSGSMPSMSVKGGKADVWGWTNEV
jgi:hypothetical protein